MDDEAFSPTNLVTNYECVDTDDYLGLDACNETAYFKFFHLNVRSCSSLS